MTYRIRFTFTSLLMRIKLNQKHYCQAGASILHPWPWFEWEWQKYLLKACRQPGRWRNKGRICRTQRYHLQPTADKINRRFWYFKDRKNCLKLKTIVNCFYILTSIWNKCLQNLYKGRYYQWSSLWLLFFQDSCSLFKLLSHSFLPSHRQRVNINAEFPGANAELMIKGLFHWSEQSTVSRLKYIDSDAGNDGVCTIPGIFELGTIPILLLWMSRIVWLQL